MERKEDRNYRQLGVDWERVEEELSFHNWLKRIVMERAPYEPTKDEYLNGLKTTGIARADPSVRPAKANRPRQRSEGGKRATPGK